MSQLEIIIGSQMGGTEYVAEQLRDLMEDQGISCALHEQPDLGYENGGCVVDLRSPLALATILIICSLLLKISMASLSRQYSLCDHWYRRF